MRDLAKLSAVDAAKRTRAGAISAAELVEAALERIAALDGRLQTFMTIDATGARRTAERLDAIPASQRGPLHGLPIAFKTAHQCERTGPMVCDSVSAGSGRCALPTNGVR